MAKRSGLGGGGAAPVDGGASSLHRRILIWAGSQPGAVAPAPPPLTRPLSMCPLCSTESSPRFSTRFSCGDRLRKAAEMRRHYGRKAVLLDEHPLWLDAVASVLENVGIEVVGKATDADTALAIFAERSPNLLVTELDLPRSDTNGLGVIRLVRAQNPDVRTIVLSQRDDAESIGAALAGGATAYVVKTAHPDDLAAAVRQAFGQSLYFGVGLVGEPPPAAIPSDVALTRREREILALVAEGRSN